MPTSLPAVGPSGFLGLRDDGVGWCWGVGTKGLGPLLDNCFYFTINEKTNIKDDLYFILSSNEKFS